MPDAMHKAGATGRPSEVPVSVIPGGMDTPIPACPATIKDATQWNRLWTVGRGWLSNEAHLDIIRIICEGMEDRDALRKAMGSRSRITRGSTGQDRVHPALKELDIMDAKLGRLLDLAGFTPERQKKLLAPQKGRLDAMRERKAAQAR